VSTPPAGIVCRPKAGTCDDQPAQTLCSPNAKIWKVAQNVELGWFGKLWVTLGYGILTER